MSSVCMTFSTCQDEGPGARKSEIRIKACWDNIKDLKLDKKVRCVLQICQGNTTVL